MGFYSEILGTLGLGEISGLLDYNIINYGGKAVYIDGFSSVIKIDASEIILGLKKNKIIVEGELNIHSLEEKAIIIKGKIDAVYLDGIKGKSNEKQEK